jgi:hypothetical protein
MKLAVQPEVATECAEAFSACRSALLVSCPINSSSSRKGPLKGGSLYLLPQIDAWRARAEKGCVVTKVTPTVS